MKLSFLLVGVLGVGLLTGCKTKLDKALEHLKDDPAEFHLVFDRNGLKIDRYNPGAVTNRATLSGDEKAKLRRWLDGQ